MTGKEKHLRRDAVDLVTVLPGTDDIFLTKHTRKIHISNCVENVTVLPGTSNRQITLPVA